MLERCSFIRGTIVVALTLGWLANDTLIAQRPEGGGPGGRGGRGGSGGPGGFRGGGGGGPGGTRSGSPGGTRSGSPGGGAADFLRRFDSNANGAIDPNEMQGPVRFMLERMAREGGGIDLSQPVSIDRLNREIEQRRSRESEDRSSGGDRSRTRGGPTTTSAPEPEPLVPGFGLELDLAPPLSFGESGEIFDVTVTEADRRAADDRFRRYDRNNDGYLSREELASGRWSDDPFLFDRNRDGRLTPLELAMRYAQSRVAESERRSGGASGDPRQRFTSSSSSSNRPSGSTSTSVDSRMAGMVNGMFDRYDANKSGVLEKDEWKSFRTDPSSADRNRDGRIDRREMTEWMSSRFQRGGSDRGRGGGSGEGEDSGGRRGWYAGRTPGSSEESNSSASSDSGDASGRVDPRNSYRFSTAADRLAKFDLPDWYFGSDSDQDGQVMMAEYAAAWSDSVARDFAQFDLSGDGVITARECMAAVENGAVRGASNYVAATTVSASQPAAVSASSSQQQSASSPVTTRSETPATAATPAPQRNDASATTPAAASAGDAPPFYVQYAVQLIKKYDTNRDNMLNSDEWSSIRATDPKAADADGNGQLTPQELARALVKR